MDTYHAAVRRDGRFWYVDLGEVGATQARHLREAESMARDYIAIVREVDPDSFALTLDIELDDEVRTHLDKAERLRAASAEAQTRAAAEVRAAARTLQRQGLPLRDIGLALGVSYQRAHQLVS